MNTIADTFHEFIDHAQRHKPCREACLQTFDPGRERTWPAVLKYYCPTGAEAIKLAMRRGL